MNSNNKNGHNLHPIEDDIFIDDDECQAPRPTTGIAREIAIRMQARLERYRKAGYEFAELDIEIDGPEDRSVRPLRSELRDASSKLRAKQRKNWQDLLKDDEEKSAE